MGNNIAVSVIMPSLNVADYIRKCMDSVVNQTLNSIELICVDAGSEDGTLEILQEYERVDSCVRVVMSERKSYGRQVNLGMRMAKGEYVAIVDTDDFIMPEMYEVLYRIAKENDVDFVKADYCEFTQSGHCVSVRKKVSVVTDKWLYGRVVSIRENQQCFNPQITATWSGIYRRKFIEENNILHNETEGAAYQDTGFWFQTYAFSARVYFENRAFYMYRTDNPASSVNSRHKVFCICDEFDYVRKVLDKKGLLEAYGDTFAYVFYRKYKRNMERIDDNFRLTFLKKFSKDFAMLYNNGLLQWQLWDVKEKQEIMEIIRDYEKYYKELSESRENFLKEAGKLQKIIIYGSGRVGKAVFDGIADKENVICFAETECRDAKKQYLGVPIHGLDELYCYAESSSLIVAVKVPEYKEEMKKNAEQHGFKNIILLPDRAFDYD